VITLALPGFSTYESGLGRETDSPLEGWRAMDSNRRSLSQNTSVKDTSVSFAEG
jgi:hypothetical protein